MNLVTRVWNAVTGRAVPARSTAPRRVRGSYDAAQSGGENENHWAWADSLNANAANSPDVRKTLRERARQEADNNGYCGGLIEKLGNALVGACPRVQVRLPETWVDPDFDREMATPPGAARAVELAFAKWAKAVNLGQKLRLLDNAAVRDGEGFAVLTTNPGLPASGPQLDVRLYECDQVDTPFLDWTDREAFPGGRIDEHGNVTEWHFLKAHPGSNVWVSNYLDFDRVPAGRVLHWFKPKRAGQLRGVPEITSSISLYAILRRYTLATLGAAEFAASIAGVLETDLPPGEYATSVDEMDEVDVPRRKLLTLPAGQKAKAFESAQPLTQYGDFKGEVLTETGAGPGAPRNIATGSSAEYNYSSGRLDLGLFRDGMKVRRHDFVTSILESVFAAWLYEAVRVEGYLPKGLPPADLWVTDWRFPGFVSLDPVKDATADDLRLRNNTITLAEIYAERGEDWEEAIEQRGRELDKLNELGLTTAMSLNSPSAPAQQGGDGEEGDPSTASQAAAAGGVQSTALNGAQITSLLLLADKVVMKQYPADAATALVQAAFPLMPKGLIQRFINGLVSAPVPPPQPDPTDTADQEAAGAAA